MQESEYFSLKKSKAVNDGLNENSVVLLLQRLMLSNFARILFISRDRWLEFGELALAYLRKNFPILAGGHAGAKLGSLENIMKVYPSTLFNSISMLEFKVSLMTLEFENSSCPRTPNPSKIW
jgi:hypothetical protein